MRKGQHCSVETIEKIQASRRKTMSAPGYVHPLKGKQHSADYKKRQSETRIRLGIGKGVPTWNSGKTGVYSKEVLQKMRNSHLGKKLSSETIQKLIDSNKRRTSVAGYAHPNKGSKHTAATREKMCISHKGIHVKERNGFYHKSHSVHSKKLIAEGLRGSNSYLWKGGTSNEPYSPEFTDELKEQVRNRDSRRCQYPGCMILENGKKHHVHHIDYDKHHSWMENLTTLCNRHHSAVNLNRDYWESYFGSQHFAIDKQNLYSQIAAGVRKYYEPN